MGKTDNPSPARAFVLLVRQAENERFHGLSLLRNLRHGELVQKSEGGGGKVRRRRWWRWWWGLKRQLLP
jgi:hypothetical protein